MEVAKWALERTDFSESAITDAFNDKDHEIITNILKKLEEIGVLQRQ